jgi:RHS repeat-associated protein
VGYDGNGNVVALAKGSDGTVGARYDYDAFGNTIRKTGAAIAQENFWEFSTKRRDKVSGMCLYEYRQLNSALGKWLSMDPIGTLDGPSIYAFIRNNSVNSSDYLGLCQKLCGDDVTQTLYNTIQDISRTFKMWKKAEKREACMSLTIWRAVGMATAWDIPYLKGVGENVVPPHLKQDLFDPEPCRRTVTVAGRCYYGGAVNYVMYGHAFKLCNDEFPPPFSGVADFTQRGMELNIMIWKNSAYRKFEEEEQQALDFAVSAYTGTMHAAYSLPCTANRTRVPGRRFEWSWAPYHERLRAWPNN